MYKLQYFAGLNKFVTVCYSFVVLINFPQFFLNVYTEFDLKNDYPIHKCEIKLIVKR